MTHASLLIFVMSWTFGINRKSTTSHDFNNGTRVLQEYSTSPPAFSGASQYILTVDFLLTPHHWLIPLATYTDCSCVAFLTRYTLLGTWRSSACTGTPSLQVLQHLVTWGLGGVIYASTGTPSLQVLQHLVTWGLEGWYSVYAGQGREGPSAAVLY
ncbi:hypothetical protein P692DRAFT_20822220 [Suillus brevipes Sb2]|nr:hypothetical protein P692DRAFT_20822220 [Suillus brevipes Sb2]